MTDAINKPRRAESRPTTLHNLGQAKLIAAGVRVTDLARIIGVSKKTASRWLRGEKRPDESHAATIEAHFGVPARSWNLAATADGARGMDSERGHERVTPPRARVTLTPVVSQDDRALPRDWKRLPRESRLHLFARRIAWSRAADEAARTGIAPPTLTSDLDPDVVAEGVARLESKLPRLPV